VTVFVAFADYGLNGAGVVRVYAKEPTAKEIKNLEMEPAHEGAPYSHRDCTGFGGIDVVEMEVT
jgi:hypothetical protein